MTDIDKSDFQEWCRVEFEQCYEHLRDRDGLILKVIEFYVGMVCAVGAASAALLGIASLQRKGLFVGIVGRQNLICHETTWTASSGTLGPGDIWQFDTG